MGECEFCPDGHGDPERRPWAVWVDRTNLDYDGQPVNLIVSKTGGQHCAESDAEWLRALIRNPPPSRILVGDQDLAALRAERDHFRAEAVTALVSGVGLAGRLENARAELAQLRANIEAERDKHRCSDLSDMFGGYLCGHCGDSYATTVGCINRQRLDALLVAPVVASGETE